MTTIVTGASKGIGRAIAERFAEGGHDLMLCARNEAQLESAATAIRHIHAGIVVRTCAADLATSEGVEKLAEQVLKDGAPDILVNNAGRYNPGNISDEAPGSLEDMISVNLYSAYHLTRKLLPTMMTARKGMIVNMCSIASLQAYPGGGAYSISKYALAGFNANLRHEMKPHGIKVMGVFPGAVMSDSWGDFDNSQGRIMLASDIAEMIFAAASLSPQAVVEDLILRPQLGDL